MSLALEVVRDKPLGFWMLDGPSPFVDYSGYNRTATLGGTQVKHFPLAKNAAYSTVVSSSMVPKFSCPIFVTGAEEAEFTLEAFIRPIQKDTTDPADQQILGHTGAYDGLVINGTVVSFVTKYFSAGEARASYDLQQLRNVCIRAVHTSSTNSLFVDGELVASINLTEEQKADTYIATDGFLYSGQTTTTRRIAIQAVSVYSSALSSDSALRHAQVGKDVVDSEDIANAFGANRYTLSYPDNDIFFDQTWTTAYDWNLGVQQNITVQNDQLLPLFLNGVSVAGTWTIGVPISHADLTSVFGVNMTWDGSGATITASLDGVTWETVQRGKNLSIIPPGFNPTGATLTVVVSFPGGTDDDPSFIDNLRIVGLITGDISPVNDRDITFSGTVSIKKNYVPIDMNDNWGTALEPGTITIGTDPDATPTNPQTIELWVRRNTTTSIVSNISSPTIYRMGVPGSMDTATPIGEWCLVFITVPSPATGPITFTGNMEIGQIVLYPQLLTTTDMQFITDSYLGRPRTRIGDNSIVSIAEQPTSAVIYAHDWSISASA